MSYLWTDLTLMSACWASEVVFLFKITTLCAITLDFKFHLPLVSFHGGWLFLLCCDDCCCWFDWLHFWLPFGFWYFFWVTCVLWWWSKLTEAFALVDRYCPVALFCLIVFAKFFICWGLKFEGLASSFDSCSITHCVVPWLLRLNRKASLWYALCSLGLKLHKSQSLDFIVKIIYSHITLLGIVPQVRSWSVCTASRFAFFIQKFKQLIWCYFI